MSTSPNLMKHMTGLFIFLAVGLALVLFSIKYQVQDLTAQLTAANRQIVAEQRALHVLHAEWSHLTDPERLISLARNHLDLEPLIPEQLGSFAALPRSPDDPRGTFGAEQHARVMTPGSAVTGELR
jgi:cell division protein FtsL